jgi:hypothetical protein
MLIEWSKVRSVKVHNFARPSAINYQTKLPNSTMSEKFLDARPLDELGSDGLEGRITRCEKARMVDAASLNL